MTESASESTVQHPAPAPQPAGCDLRQVPPFLRNPNCPSCENGTGKCPLVGTFGGLNELRFAKHGEQCLPLSQSAWSINTHTICSPVSLSRSPLSLNTRPCPTPTRDRAAARTPAFPRRRLSGHAGPGPAASGAPRRAGSGGSCAHLAARRPGPAAGPGLGARGSLSAGCALGRPAGPRGSPEAGRGLPPGRPHTGDPGIPPAHPPGRAGRCPPRCAARRGSSRPSAPRGPPPGDWRPREPWLGTPGGHAHGAAPDDDPRRAAHTLCVTARRPGAGGARGGAKAAEAGPLVEEAGIEGPA